MYNKIIILKDHNGYTFTSLKDDIHKSIKQEQLKSKLLEKGYDVSIISLLDICTNTSFESSYVFYPSNEINGLFYKEYIEDILLDMELKGATLLPRYTLFRAHHNKVFMEKIRASLTDDRLKTIKSVPLYDERDLRKNLKKIEYDLKYPVVLKMSSGSGSRGVALVKDCKTLKTRFLQMSAVKYRNYGMKWYSNPMLSKLKTNIKRLGQKSVGEHIYPHEKMIVQNFIPNLKYDYKVLVFGEKFYILKRLTRKNDFRASGSGQLIFPCIFDDEIRKVLDIAQLIFDELKIPMLSVDIAYDGKNCHVIEFQCVSFGPYTLQFSDRYYSKVGNNWKETVGESVLEDEIANAIDWYIKRKFI